MTLVTRLQAIGAALEGTAGTGETLDAGDAAFNVFDPVFTPDITMVQRTAQATLSVLSAIPAGRMANITFSVELAGNGSSAVSPGWADVFLPACGMTKSTQTWSFDDDALDADDTSLTIGHYMHGKLWQATGCKGTWTLNFPSSGGPGQVDFEFWGVYAGSSDVTLVAPTLPTVDPPRWASATVTWNSIVLATSTLTIAANNTVKVLESPAAAAAYSRAIITSRGDTGPTITADPEGKLVATSDPHGALVAGTEAAFSLIHGPTNNKLTLAAPKAQYTSVSTADRDGVHTEPATWQCNRNSANNDEITLTFG